MEKRFKTEKLVIRILFCLVSLMGCVWQVLDISGVYFAYETTVSVQFKREVIVEMPALTICTNISYAANTTYLRHRYADQLSNITDSPENKWIFVQFIRNLTLNEQLMNATIGSHEFIDNCLVLQPIGITQVDRYAEDGYIRCKHVANVEESITYERKCFTIMSQNTSQLGNNANYRVDHNMMFRDNAFPLYSVVVYDKHLKDLVLFIHSRRQPFVGFIGGQTNGIHINNTKYMSSTLSYSKVTTSLLPAPYQTDCLDYPSVGYRSQSHCLSKCREIGRAHV